MATEYVDAGQAIKNSTLSGIIGHAPPVAKGVTYDRILNAREEPQNWLTYYGAYDGQRYSPLDQINKENVKRLTPAWVFQCGSVGLHAGKSTYSFEASPLVVDGVMFVSGWDGWIWAIDARTGSELWRYKHAIPYDVSLCCGNVNRGVAVADGLVFAVTLNAHVIAPRPKIRPNTMCHRFCPRYGMLVGAPACRYRFAGEYIQIPMTTPRMADIVPMPDDQMTN